MQWWQWVVGLGEAVAAYWTTRWLLTRPDRPTKHTRHEHMSYCHCEGCVRERARKVEASKPSPARGGYSGGKVPAGPPPKPRAFVTRRPVSRSDAQRAKDWSVRANKLDQQIATTLLELKRDPKPPPASCGCFECYQNRRRAQRERGTAIVTWGSDTIAKAAKVRPPPGKQWHDWGTDEWNKTSG